MDSDFQRYSVRNLSSNSVEQIRELCRVSRLPAGAVVEDAVKMLWSEYELDSDAPDSQDEPLADYCSDR